ncbi:winged helix-turn-helix transcriptional regulator [Microbispora amethystogenes]|uniref:winged helix-turn-helix transcriptional regulator n=1 Tax=Microbispora amethystogenes TaxID=1427754 RepID=UPI0033F31FD7
MNDIANGVFQYVTEHEIASAIFAGLGLFVAWITWLIVRDLWRSTRRTARRLAADRPAEDLLTVIAASIATGVSAQGMWRFSGDVLHFDGPLRLLLFAFIEVAMVTSAVRARRNMRENYKAGVDGLAVWALTGLSAVLSSMDAASFAEAIFRLAAPLVAAWLWERGMSIERQRLTGRTRINWRLTPERVLVRIGLAEASDRTASEVDAHRRLTRVALAAKRVRALREAGAPDRKMRGALARLDKAMDAAVEHTGLAQDTERQERLLAQLGALYNTVGLTEVKVQPFWEKADETAAAEERTRLGEAAIVGALGWRERRAEILAPLVASAAAGVTAHREEPTDAQVQALIARLRRQSGGDTGTTSPAPVSPPNTTRQATADTTNEATRQPAEGDNRHDNGGDNRRPPTRQKGRQRRALAAGGRRHDSTTARTRQGDTTGDIPKPVVQVAELLQQEPPPTQGDIAARLGKSVRTVQRYIDKAEEKGLLPSRDTTRDTTP